MNPDHLLKHFDQLSEAPDAVPRLRRFILDLAVRGKLVEQDPEDEPVKELLRRIEAEKAKFIKINGITKSVSSPTDIKNEQSFEIPSYWKWAHVEDIAHLEMGQSPSSEFYNQGREGLPFYQGKADFGKINPTPRHWCTAPTKLAQDGDILISVRAPVGPTNIATEACCIGRGLAALRPFRR
jgi:type I restriction enzyme S subunit